MDGRYGMVTSQFGKYVNQSKWKWESCGSSTPNKPNQFKLNFSVNYVYVLHTVSRLSLFFQFSENRMSSSKDVNGNFTIPEWVSEDIFIDILKEDVEGFVGIRSFKVEPGSSVGENYMSIILRVSIGVHLTGMKWFCLLFPLVILVDVCILWDISSFFLFYQLFWLYFCDISWMT